MKKILFLAAMLSFLAIYSCQDNAVPENNDVPENNEEGSTPVTVEGSYTIGGRSGKITSAYYGISSTGECWFFLRPDGLAYSLLPPYDNFYLVISFPEQTPKLQPGTYTKSDDGGIQSAEFVEGTDPDVQVHRIESAKAELSETGDYYTLTLSGNSGDDIVSVTYTGPFFEADFDTQSILGSGSYSIGNFSSSLRYANAKIDGYYDESENRTTMKLSICSVPENVNGTNRINEFCFYLRFPGKVSELQPGTYKETDDVIRKSCYNPAGKVQSIDFKTLTLEISEEGTDYQGTDYKIKATGTLADEDESTVSVDFSGYVTYQYY